MGFCRASAALALVVAVAAPARAGEAADLWNKQCASCHGQDGKGDTKPGKMMGVRDLTDPEVRAEFDKARIVKAIEEGVFEEGTTKRRMKGYAEKLSAEQIAALMDYVYALAGDEAAGTGQKTAEAEENGAE